MTESEHDRRGDYVRTPLFSVKHFLEHKALRRRGGSCSVPVLCFEYADYVVGRNPAGAGVRKRSGNDPDHVVEEAGACNLNDDVKALSSHVYAVNTPDGILPVRMRAERGEIMFADKM